MLIKLMFFFYFLNIISSLLDFLSLTGEVAGGKIEKNEMGGACGAYGGGESCAQASDGET
jgi:hypothetical protein